MNIVITGVAGFIGCHLAISLKHGHKDWTITGLDNLRRRGAELNLGRLAAAGITFIHGDIRNPEDLDALPACDVLVECSAEPSVLAAYQDASRYVINTNLVGTINCLEYARQRARAVLFLSTSRVYPIETLNNLNLREEETRLVLDTNQEISGVSTEGINESFPLSGHRTLYGTTKLCSELLLQEYAAMHGLHYVINRCGLVAGPWQWARSDQGVIALWAARHYFGGSLKYIGYGGQGKQLRDVLHVTDLVVLIEHEIEHMDDLSGNVFNVGGGSKNAISLAELSQLCTDRSQPLPIGSEPANRPGDIPYYVTDNRRVIEATGWRPERNVDEVLDDLFAWFQSHEAVVRAFLAG